MSNPDDNTISLETIEKLRDLARKLPNPIGPLCCESCGGELYMIAGGGIVTINSASPCPLCGGIAVDPKKLPDFIVSGGLAYLPVEKS